ncbi:MAG: S8 family serine peptidase [Bacteroidia bacterium]
MQRKLTLLLLLIITFSLSFAQERYTLKIEGAGFVPVENALSMEAWTVEQDEVFKGKVYRIWQFNSIPTTKEWERMEELGVEQLFYLPERAFLVSIPEGLSAADARPKDLRAILPWEARFKAHAEIKAGALPEWSMDGDKAVLYISHHADVNMEDALADLNARGFRAYDVARKARSFMVQVDPEQIDDILALPYISWIEPLAEPAKPEDMRGKTLHRSNAVFNNTNGVEYDGTGVHVMVRDDGFIGPHIDFKNRIYDFSRNNNGNHGDLVGGAMASGSNFNPRIRGSASGAQVYVLNYASRFNDNTLQLHQDSNVVITNSSYSDGCNSGYSNTSGLLDEMLLDNPHLMHVFSSGNNGGAACRTPYVPGADWGNITGGHKLGKNVITVGNINDNGIIAGSSSRGPATDGRIKPEIMANGVGFFSTDENNTTSSATGTSFSAPALAGVMAQMYHAYRDLNRSEPDAALIKSVLMNTADDKGNKGPDFRYGFGNVNAKKAYQVLEDKRYAIDSVDLSSNTNIAFQVPAGLTQLKVMVYWADREAFAGSTKDLVDDLDCTLNDPAGGIFSPLVLNSTPNVVALNTPAAPGLDQLNNMEQFVMDNPSGGAYSVDVFGNIVTNGARKFYVVFEYIKPELEITYPIGGERFVPGVSEILHWDAPEQAGAFDIWYNNGKDTLWRIIRLGLNQSNRHFSWQVPNDITGKAKVRITSGGGLIDESPNVFNIMTQTSSVWVSAVCQDNVKVSWMPVQEAETYEVYKLGDKYMELVGIATDTTFSVPNIRYQEENWFAVSAVSEEKALGLRTIAINQRAGRLVNCAPQAPVAGFGFENNVCVSTPIRIQDSSQNAPDNYFWSIIPGSFNYTGGTNAISRIPIVNFSAPGVYSISQIVINPQGRDTIIRTITVSPRPNVSFTSSRTGNDVQFTTPSTGINGYFWEFGDGTTSTDPNPLHTYNQSGTFQVKLTASTSCGTITTEETITFYPVSIEPSLGGLDLRVYPNPNQGQFTVRIHDIQPSTVEIALRDVLGRAVKTYEGKAAAGSFVKQFDWSNLQEGIYLLNVKAGDKNNTVKIQIRK